MQKVLVIAYYWPPAGGPGVQRWLKFVKYLPELGFEPIVFIPENPHYPIQDISLLHEVPTSVEIIKHPIVEPYNLASIFSQKKTKRISSGIIQDFKKQSLLERLFLWIRGNLFIPDARKFWIKPSIKVLTKVISEKEITTVITTGPPHSVHLIGNGLKEKLNIHWIADFRDPWTSIGYHKRLKLTQASKKRHRYLENKVLNTADALVVTSNATKHEFTKITTKPIAVITNGYDEKPPQVPLDPEFSISHIGSLLTARNPKNLWKALSELVQKNKDLQSKLKIRLIGTVGEGVVESLKDLDLYQFVELLGYLPHDEVLKNQAKSQLLLLLEIDSMETRGIIPGKLFEYFNAKRPIFAIGPKEWEAGIMVEEHQAGDYVYQGDFKGIKKLLLERFEQFQSGKLVSRSKKTNQYHRRELTKKLAKLLVWESS